MGAKKKIDDIEALINDYKNKMYILDEKAIRIMYKFKISQSRNKKNNEELNCLKGYIDHKLSLISSSKITVINFKSNLKEIIEDKSQIRKKINDLNKDNINNLDEICDDFIRYGLEPEQFIDKILTNHTGIINSEISRIENAIKLNNPFRFDYD